MASLLPITVYKPPKRRVAAVAPVAPDPYAPLVKMALSGVQNPAQIAATANTQALAREKEMLAASKAVSDQTIAQYNNQATRAEGFAGALARLQAGEDQQAQARYSESADRLAGLGAGLTGAVGAGYQSGVDRTREAVANLTGGLGSVTATPGADISNAAQYTGATMPANTLESNAAAAARLEQSDAAARALNLHHIGQDYTGKADDAIAQAASDARALIAKRPATIAELVNTLTANRQTGISNLASVIGARATYNQQQVTNQQTEAANKLAARKAAFDRWIQTQQLHTTQGYLTSKQNQDYMTATGKIPGSNAPTYAAQQDALANTSKRAGLAAQWTSYNHFKSDWRGEAKLDAKGNKQPTGGYKLDASGNVIKPSAASTSLTNKLYPNAGGLSVKDWNKLDAEARTEAGDLVKGTKPDYQWVPPQFDDNGDVRPGTGGFIATKGTGVEGLGYAGLVNHLLNKNGSPAWQAEAIKIANGMFAPGEGGRPWGRGPVAQRTVKQAVRLGFKNQIPADKLADALIGRGLPGDLVRKTVKGIYKGAYFAGAAYDQPQVPPKRPEVGAFWDEGDDPIVGPGPVSGTFKTKNGGLIVKGGLQPALGGVGGPAVWQSPHYLDPKEYA